MHTYHTNYLLKHTEHSLHTLIRSRLKTHPVQVRSLCHALCKVDMSLLYLEYSAKLLKVVE